MKKIALIFLLSITPVLSFAQKDISRQIDSLKYVTNMPFICRGTISTTADDMFVTEKGDTIYTEGCGNATFWKVVSLKEKAIRPLINKLADTTQTEAPVIYFGGNYSVADVAYAALQEIIHNIPTFELLDAEFDEGCGYCSYWHKVRESTKNRRKFQLAVQKWYNKNKANFAWIESDDFAICDYIGEHPSGGHYKVKKINGEYPAVYQLKKISEVADSVIIKTLFCRDRETYGNEPIAISETGEFKQQEIRDTTYVIALSKLTNKEIKEFNDKLNNFGGVIALPNHCDIQLDYYVKDSIYSVVTISSIFRKINIIHKFDCEGRDTDWTSPYLSCFFMNEISNDMKKYLTKLLRKKKLWSKSDGFYKWD